MKKLFAVFAAAVLMLSLTACGKKAASSEAAAQSVSLVGEWVQEHQDGEDYQVLTLAEDGSGSLMTIPMEIGTALAYEVEGSAITAHLGSADDNTPMEYLPESDQISYSDKLFNRS